jgi:glycosyltransferase involved in cell wall biosynthesis
VSALPGLSIVMPVYNEPEWTPVAVRDAVEAQQRSGFADAEIILVDDGSDEPTRRALDAIEAPIDVRVLHQENQGRFGARRTGIRAARHELVLLVDARVSLRPDALRFVSDRLRDGEALPAWNGHIDVEVEGNAYARFWNVLTDAAFAEYFSNPRTTSFGLEEFDRFPKGTTAFLAPRDVLLDAIDAFGSMYADAHDANDDTTVIRHIAERQRINISPGFSASYRGRRSLRDFLRHARHRGTVFLDGYGRPGTRFFPIIAAFFPISASSVLVLARRPRLGLAALALPAVWAGVGVKLRRPAADVAALAALGPAWLVAYAAGMWRGLFLALTSSSSSPGENPAP